MMTHDFSSTFLAGDGLFVFSDFSFAPTVAVSPSRPLRKPVLRGSVANYSQGQIPTNALLDGPGNPLLDGQGNYLLGG